MNPHRPQIKSGSAFPNRQGVEGAGLGGGLERVDLLRDGIGGVLWSLAIELVVQAQDAVEELSGTGGKLAEAQVESGIGVKRQVARHQSVYAAVADELAGPVHALALHTYTPGEWAGREQAAPASPACLGGSKADGAVSGS